MQNICYTVITKRLTAIEKKEDEDDESSEELSR